MEKSGNPLKNLLRFDLMIFLLVLFIPLIFFPSNSPRIIAATLICIASRASSFYDNLKIEVHSVLILAMSHIYGPATGIFAAVMSALLLLPVGKILGGIQRPPWIVLDTIYLAVLAYASSITPARGLFITGMLTIIIVGNLIAGFIRVYILNDALSRRIPLSVLNIMFNYLLLKNFLPQILGFFH